MGWWKRLPAEEKQRLARLDSAALSRVARALGVHPKSLYNHVCAYRAAQREMQERVQIPPSPTPDYSDFYVLDGNDFMVIGDLEIPDHDATMLRRCMEVAARAGIRRLIVAGDFMHADQFSTWPSLYAKSGELNFADSLRLAKQIIRALRQQFDDVYFISGNHDQRIARATSGQVHLGLFLEQDGVHFSQYAYMYLYTRRGPVWIGHVHGGGAPLTVAHRIYRTTVAPNGEKCHIILPHFHAQAMDWSEDGLRELHVLPCIRDSVKTSYKRMSANAYRQWIGGALKIQNGYFTPLTKDGTDWSVVLGE